MDATQHAELDGRHLETLVIGAGQAGLATAYHLGRHGRECLVVDAARRVGDGWRHQWDSLRLYTPAWADGLPGRDFPGPRWHFPSKDEFADFLEQYADALALPVRLGTRVLGLRRPESGAGFEVSTDAGTTSADNVVVATGTFGRRPSVPHFADQIDPSVVQLHSSEYRNPEQLPDGPVLVVGSSHSGCDVAYEVAATRATMMAGRDTGQIPVPFTSPLAKVVMPVMLFAMMHVMTRTGPPGRKQVQHVRLHGGGPRLRVQTADLARRNVDWVKDHVTGVEGGLPVVGDRGPVPVASVIWCTGFRQDFGWIELDVFDEHGWPREFRGTVEEEPGLFFTGLAFQSAAGSMLVHGAGRDAARVVRQIVRRPVAGAPVRA
ncbi:NAD(P)/FAD-dependent oxidoreductase [Ornithinimicrobium sp. F0845]|uniref:flavin-containing monooxygenase n=1 Tax=Ornithinimicrobium sp. F0845 TaxID=2926412 RepID=UPI001FF47E0D|nr:FAD-dependent oxidoreductase [Ornithinimicrobium sp. F0845]MCK0112518.1 NAD(P)/FAD-dependent oxidoreductase [Ornithinimicrobium sp. F0845]